MNLDPRLNEARLPWRHSAIQQLAFPYRKYCFATGVFGMYMGRVMLFGVELIHVNQDAVKRTDEWHGQSFLSMRVRGLSISREPIPAPYYSGCIFRLAS